MGTGATSKNMNLVHWPLMGGLLHLVQRGGDWAGPQPAQAPPRGTKCNSPPINGQCTNHRTAVKVKERIVLRKIHLRTTGRNLSMVVTVQWSVALQF